MADIEWLVDQVDRSPEGPHIGAFFDFDGTIIAGYSALAFFKYRLRRGDMGPKEMIGMVKESINVERRGADIDELMRVGVRAQMGKAEEEVESWARSVFSKEISSMIYLEARALIEAHMRRQHTVVIASSATRPQIQATAEDLGIDHILCTEMEVSDGAYTGSLASDIRWGEGKAKGVRQFAQENGIELAESFAYSNGAEDLPFLATVGHPIALNPDDDLAPLAEQQGWPVARLQPPPETSPVHVVRTGAALGLAAGTLSVASLLALANRDRSWGANLLSGLMSDVTLAAAGVQVRVVGEENAWTSRPAVFVFNHQSQLDPFILGAVLRKDFSGVAKKSLQRDPLFGPVGYMTNVVYIDRADKTKAISGLDDAVAALQSGTSIAIAPEGTRSPTPRLLPFKKGPFHLCLQAGVPMVPIVMRNCGQIMAPHSMVVHSGVVDVAVLPPIPTDDWTRENLNEQVAKVRQLYLDTMADWPSDGLTLR